MDHKQPIDCPVGVENKGRLKALEDRMDKVEKGVWEIRDKLINRLPWPVVVIVSLLIGLCSTLLTLVLKH